MLELVPKAGNYFGTDVHMKHYLTKLLPHLLESKQLPLKNAVLQMMVALHTSNPTMFVCQLVLVQLPLSTQLEARKLLRASIADLDRQLAAVSQS
jgi:hypothetical protein